MPPHCDTLDGPVVIAAKKALETGNVNWILPWVHAGGERQVREAFEKALAVRRLDQKAATELADFWFYETAVRVHREGEGAPYTGLKPAGQDFGPLLPKVDKSVESSDADELIHTLQHAIKENITEKFRHVLHTKNYDVNDVAAARKYVQHYLGLALFSHHLYETITSGVSHAEVEENAAKKDHHAAAASGNQDPPTQAAHHNH